MSVSALARCLSSSILALAVLACTTTRTVEPAGASNARAQQLRPERTWHLLENGEPRGVVVQFAASAEPGARRPLYYSVQNARRQELGMIDAQGRAWRYEVHQREAHWLLTGTLLEGARAILGAGPAAELAEAPQDGAQLGTSTQ
jgi:hypothetical protein